MIGIEIVDRYSALGIEPPEPRTQCMGHCEGTGWVPVYKPSPEEGVFYSLNQIDIKWVKA